MTSNIKPSHLVHALFLAVIFLVFPSAGSAVSIADYEISDNATGGDCNLIGTWDDVTKTCVLTTDLTGTGTAAIQVSSNDITLDGGYRTLTGNGTGSDIGVYLAGVSGITIRNLNVESFGYGIYLDGSSNNMLTGNTGTGNNLNALYIGSSNDNEISNNSLMSNASNGVRLDNATGNTFTGNTVNNNGAYGIQSSWSNQTNFLGNEASSNSLDGIRIENSDNCQLTLNTITGNAQGLYFSSADNTAISGNNLATNATGISINNSSNTSVYNNNFLSNTLQAEVAGGSGNVFNLAAPEGGNYWDNFDEVAEGCIDTHGNNLCDAPFIFTGGQDSLPWTGFNGWVDTTAPTVQNVLPSGVITSDSTTISADYSDDGGGIDTSSVNVTLDGAPLTSCTVGASSVSCPVSGLGGGAHAIGGSVSDLAGNPSNITGSFTMSRNYYFTWYDDYYASNWVLMANPASASQDVYFETMIGSQKKDLSVFQAKQGSVPGSECTSCSAGQVPVCFSLTPNFPGVDNMNGPVKVSSLTADQAVISERTVWPKGGSSLEEVVGIDESRLSSHYYWTWYDQHSSGYTNWVLVANPSESEIVRVEIEIAGQVMTNTIDPARADYQQQYFDIGAGENVTPSFSGVIGGPVEVRAYRGPSAAGGNDVGAWDQTEDRRKVIASQRVLSGFGISFNEAVGVPAEELSDHYVWSWYDAAEPGARNWVLIANPQDAATSVYYEIRVGGTEVCHDGNCLADPSSQGAIAPGDYVAPEFPGVRGGPVEVLTFSDAGHNKAADSIASQRIAWGLSFGETMGFPYSDLASDYHWTWYDEVSAGMRNWILVANTNNFEVDYQVSIGGIAMSGPGGSGTLQPAGSTDGSGNHTDIVTPDFAGQMGGPVEVTAVKKSDGTPADVIASQRVLYNGFFNEVVGTVLN